MSRRKKKSVAPESHERWLITYADLITLLMIFFIVLYAMSEVEKSKFDQLMISLNSALAPSESIQGVGQSGFVGRVSDKPPNQDAEENHEDAGEVDQKEEELQEVYEKLLKYIEEQNLQDYVEVLDTPRGIQISIKDIVLYDSGKAELKTEAIDILSSISGFLSTLNHYISIEGHTDTTPINTSKYPSNWELSAARALSVMHYLVDKQNINPDRVRIVGYGQYQEVKDNTTSENRQANRRVAIVILR